MIKELKDVVVTALGISRESKSLGYARQSIDTESLLDTRDPNLLNSLSGKVSGAQLYFEWRSVVFYSCGNSW